MGVIHAFVIIFACMLVLSLEISGANDSINAAQFLRDGNTLVSKGGKFELGFFSPGSSQKRYLGIWYKNIPVTTYVWVANGANPINDSSGILTVNTTGNLVLTQNGSLVWHSNNSHKQAQNPVVEMLDSGNLVIRNEGETNPEEYLWQSFDYPSDTLLPGMKLGWDLRTGLERKYTAWKSQDDPSPGDVSRVLKLYNYPEVYMMKGTQKLLRYGPWNGEYFSGMPDLLNNTIFGLSFVSNEDEIYYAYTLVNDSVPTRTVTNQSGTIVRYVWKEDEKTWKTYRTYPKESCDNYDSCGPNGLCVRTQSQPCNCLKGFSPKSPQNWNSSDWKEGCERNKALNCSSDVFVLFKGLKVPATTDTWLNKSIGLKECKVKCLKDCSCMAYTNSDIRNGGSGCVLWFGDLIDMKQIETGGQDLYIRMNASEAEPGPSKHTLTIVASTVAAICGVLILLSTYIICRLQRNKAGISCTEDISKTHVDGLDVQLFDLVTIGKATNNFSTENIIGEGGFGHVYKGIIDGKEIAVKTLSRSSWQGVTEFINEVNLTAKLQHRNLIKLLGCCIRGEERMLIYQYMENGSLDSLIFDDKRGKFLEWPQRFQIICGIARGLVYLHQDSPLRIIHRDLKASNILLDKTFNPKISDFGVSRSFGVDQFEGSTSRVVGTCGYMAPEYAVDGLFSEKSDVFSFGILVLEIVCGKRNRGLYQKDKSLNLVAHSWTLWKAGKAIDFIASNMKTSSCVMSEVLRCLHVGLLCVQQYPDDRPTMKSVILMLESHIALAEPKEPGFLSRNVLPKDLGSNMNDTSSTNEVTITLLEPR
ncbi:hypothetical protein LR48_Vigan08g030300 [Vigna angularis]|uniref:Receptor-like serine/threonine-protein kinase n=2 Tax=Phaseolus angularis TaxID=3914 RepID=A0A0L9V3F3_PHAAN|nr:G-type lectin S-receptor-like serine/threonine-protein kinase At4g27290 isoform X1 [Vigna angularis]KAG2396609.1 G-type lectin S-receptor-like serine/threonine-protein [Vigna angularis]KOM49476.1 hypothetical protein LR48_Vigan08g030300 [Vigna angularis]BAT89392.1 hypothetical protein VIGAN_06033900 [Vigna angularis var. angularis]